MADPNVNEPEWDRDFADEPFRSRAMQLAPRAGAEELGASLYQIDPGGAIAPYHLHHGNEEMLLVLSGTPELRTPDGARTLEPGAVVAFPRGPRGAHRVSNPGEEPARIIMISTMRFPEIAEHPDTGTVLSMTGPMEGKSFPAGTDVSFMDTVMAAMQAAKGRGTGG